jgi:hypothetical protein
MVCVLVLYEQASVVPYLQALAASVLMAGSEVNDARALQYAIWFVPKPTVEFVGKVGVHGVEGSLAHVLALPDPPPEPVV